MITQYQPLALNNHMEMALAGDWMVSIQVSLFYNLIQPAKETVGLKGLVTLSTKTLTTSTVLILSMF